MAYSPYRWIIFTQNLICNTTCLPVELIVPTERSRIHQEDEVTTHTLLNRHKEELKEKLVADDKAIYLRKIQYQSLASNEGNLKLKNPILARQTRNLQKLQGNGQSPARNPERRDSSFTPSPEARRRDLHPTIPYITQLNGDSHTSPSFHQ